MKNKKLHAILFAFFLGTFSTITFFSNQLKAQSGYPVIDTSDMEASYYFHGSFRDSTGKNAAAYPQSTILTSDRFCHPMSAAQLTNPNSYLRVEDHAALDFTDVLSISFWIYLDSLPESETRIISKSDPASPSEDSYWISIYPGDETSSGTPWSFSFRDADGTVQTFRSEWGMITEDWEYYTVTFDGSNVTMYMDLEPVAEFNTGSTTILPNAHPLWIGNLVENGITGKFDDIVLYSRIIQVQELEEYIVQSILWPDNERPLLGTCAGETVDLISRHQGPLLQYTFFKDGDIIQDGGDSICSVTIEAESDFGEYSCLAYNCIESHTKYFDVEQVFDTTGMEIIEQPYEFSQRENSIVRIRLSIEGTTDLTTYQWYHNGVPVDKRNKNREIDNLSASDTGYYYCEITDQCTKIYTDSIHVMLLSRETYPSVDTSGLRAFYAFAGNYTDSTGNTGPGVVSSVVPDTGIFGTPSQSARFSGDDSYLEIPEDPDLDIMDQLTIALSLKIDTIPDMIEPLLSKPDHVADSVGNYALFIDPGLHIIFAITASDGTVHQHISTYTLTQGAWHLITATFNGVELNTYLDGIADLAAPATGITMKEDDNALIIGNQGAGSKSFLIDDFRLFQRAMDVEEILEFKTSHMPNEHGSPQTFSACVGDTMEIQPDVSGPFLMYTFSRDGIVLQDGPSSSLSIPITSEEDFGQYQCTISNGYGSIVINLEVESGKLYDNLYIYDVAATEIHASNGDNVNLWFYVNSNLEYLVYEMYHNGNLIPDVFRGIYTIDQATMTDTGAYYFVVLNGCERLVSDTVHLIMEGQEYINYKVAGWDWTGNISGSGSSYFSSISAGSNGSFHLLGHFGGGLKVEDTAVFSSVTDDVFIVKYAENGDYQWSKFLTSTHFKGKGDLAVDSDGNVYVTGSFSNEIQIEDQVLITDKIFSGYIAKFTSSGDLLWIKHLETTRSVNCDNIEIDADDHIYLGGNFTGSLTIGSQEVTGTWGDYANVMFLARMNTTGSCEWISHAVTDADIGLFGLIDIDLSSSAEVVTSGTFTGEVDFGNGVTLTTMIEAPFLVKFNAEGVAQWGSSIDTEFGFAEAFDVSVDEQDRIFMTGMYLRDIAFGEFSVGNNGDFMEEVFLARFDHEGICTALSSYGSQGDGGDFGICYEPISDTTGYLMGMFGDLLIMGEDTLEAIPGSGAGGISPNMFIAKLTDNGEPLVLKSAGVRGNSFFGEIQVTGDGRLYFAGLNTGVSMKKGTAEESVSIAFVGYKEQGIPEGAEVDINLQETICLGDSIQFRNHWYHETGIYRVTVKNPLGVDTIYTMDLVAEICSFTEEDLHQRRYMIYPNPTSNVMYVKSPDSAPFDLKVYGMSGNLMLHCHDQAEYSIDVIEYPPGIYILKLTKEGIASINKIMIQ